MTKDFAELIGRPYGGSAKSREEIAATTPGKPARRRDWSPPAGYEPHRRLEEWELAETRLSRDEFIRQVMPMSDRIVVKFVDEPQRGRIVLTDRKQLISGDLRKAVVLKTGPGRWISGEWWLIKGRWKWIDGYRRPVSVQANQLVAIGNWVDLEVGDIALCQEADVRLTWN